MTKLRLSQECKDGLNTDNLHNRSLSTGAGKVVD